MSQTVLHVDSVSKSYGALKALDEISLSVTRGEFVALLGPNGAGKSTLFQLLTGLFVPDMGSIEIDTHNLRHKGSQALAALGVVFQQTTLDLDLTVRANLRFHARLHGMGKAASERIKAELDRIGLLEQADTPVRALSGGNRRKVEVARALLHQPALLLMDEPTVGLDLASRQALLKYVHELCAGRGLGVLWATHLVDEVEDADRVIVLHKGRRLAAATPDVLCEQAGSTSLAGAFLALTGETPKTQEVVIP